MARRSCVTQALASRAVATRGVDTCLCVTFEVVHKVKFGEQVAVIGLDGTWDPKNAARLHWHAGHRWAVSAWLLLQRSQIYANLL